MHTYLIALGSNIRHVDFGNPRQVVDAAMSQKLFDRAPEPKTLFYIPEGEHLRLYQPGADSYLLAIQGFMSQIGVTGE